MNAAEVIPILVFVAIASGVLALISGRSVTRDRIATRLDDLSEGAAPEHPESGAIRRLAGEALPAMGASLAAWDGEQATDLRPRLVVAGFSQKKSLHIFLGVKLVLILTPWLVGIGLGLLGILKAMNCMIGAAMLSALGLVLPGMYLEYRKKGRQRELRKALPDFFDILVMCLEGGMSILAACRLVTAEMKSAYPLLWRELRLVEHEIELGRPMSEAIRRFADRTDLDEIASLASVIGQAERLGTGLGKPLRILADSLRVKRVRKAEEMARKAETKVIFPTLLFIFPGVFAIILGPMASQIMHMFPGKK